MFNASNKGNKRVSTKEEQLGGGAGRNASARQDGTCPLYSHDAGPQGATQRTSTRQVSCANHCRHSAAAPFERPTPASPLFHLSREDLHHKQELSITKKQIPDAIQHLRELSMKADVVLIISLKTCKTFSSLGNWLRIQLGINHQKTECWF
ncbi:hypothetical protein lerEdw1_011114 [Lerista edwardsae]|nr:hypothetical protein lerEdw1_011114 [Lerista edwardsae]